MKDVKTPLGNDWNETRPAVFQRKSYSLEQVRRLDRRPDDLIRAALGKASKVQDGKSIKR